MIEKVVKRHDVPEELRQASYERLPSSESVTLATSSAKSQAAFAEAHDEIIALIRERPCARNWDELSMFVTRRLAAGSDADLKIVASCVEQVEKAPVHLEFAAGIANAYLKRWDAAIRHYTRALDRFDSGEINGQTSPHVVLYVGLLMERARAYYMRYCSLDLFHANSDLKKMMEAAKCTSGFEHHINELSGAIGHQWWRSWGLRLTAGPDLKPLSDTDIRYTGANNVMQLLVLPRR